MGAEAQQGIMMRAALVAMLLVLPAAVAYSSGSSYASGKSSAYASAASAYASASKAAPSPPNTVTIQVVKATITLPGVTAASFNANTAAGKKVRLAFQASVAKDRINALQATLSSPVSRVAVLVPRWNSTSRLPLRLPVSLSQAWRLPLWRSSKLRADDMFVEPTLHVCVMRAGTDTAHNIMLPVVPTFLATPMRARTGSTHHTRRTGRC